MNITINYKKRIKNSYIKSGISEYKKRISRFCKIEINDRYKVSEKTFIIKISKKAEPISSEEFAKNIDSIFISGKSNIIFVFNGYENSNFSLNLFNIDIEDEILILLLYEQIYRSLKINNNETYHK